MNIEAYKNLPEHRVPPVLARSFLRGAARHLVEAAWEFSRSLECYWLHLRIAASQVILSFRMSFLEWAGLQRQTETVAFEPPVVNETETPVN